MKKDGAAEWIAKQSQPSNIANSYVWAVRHACSSAFLWLSLTWMCLQVMISYLLQVTDLIYGTVLEVLTQKTNLPYWFPLDFWKIFGHQICKNKCGSSESSIFQNIILKKAICHNTVDNVCLSFASGFICTLYATYNCHNEA